MVRSQIKRQWQLLYGRVHVKNIAPPVSHPTMAGLYLTTPLHFALRIFLIPCRETRYEHGIIVITAFINLQSRYFQQRNNGNERDDSFVCVWCLCITGN